MCGALEEQRPVQDRPPSGAANARVACWDARVPPAGAGQLLGELTGGGGVAVDVE